jgi:outer membrane lipoprotein-sorting protein
MLRPSLSSAFKRTFPGICLLILVMSFTSELWAGLSPIRREQVMGLVEKMEAASAQLEEYQTETEVNEFRKGRVATKRFLYTFKKPNHVRIDMESPYPGMILVYPDDDGKVAVKPGGWAGFLKLHLSLDSALLRSSAGQRIDQTNLGLLIRNIAHSLTDRRRGEIKAAEQDGRVLIEVLAEDHFHADVVTLYRFSIDKARSLPVEVEELTPDGIPKRKVIFRNLRTSGSVLDSYFRINGGNSGHGQSDR